MNYKFVLESDLEIFASSSNIFVFKKMIFRYLPKTGFRHHICTPTDFQLYAAMVLIALFIFTIL
jgi:hypothetical protein